MILNPNCSEAVTIIRVNKLKPEEVAQLVEEINVWGDEVGGEGTTATSEDIFGVEVVRIDGEIPYHYSEELRKRLLRYKITPEDIHDEPS